MIINSQAAISVTGGYGLYVIEMSSGIRLELSAGMILMLAKILYNSLILKVEDIEKRRKIEQYIISHDAEMRQLGNNLYKEISGEQTNISYLCQAIQYNNISDLVKFIEDYGFAAFK